MFFSYFFQAASTFLAIIEGLILGNIFLSFIMPEGKLRNLFEWSIEPILTPVRFLVQKSIIRISGVDVSYIIAYVVINYFHMLIK